PGAAQQYAMREARVEIFRRGMKGAIDLAGAQPLERLAHLRLDDHHIDMGIARLKPRDRARQDRCCEHRAGADNDLTAARGDEIIELALRAADLADDEAGAPLQR